eukprot:scaffold183180_cov20-Tisochrysis_lutea.AAC.1
MPEQASSLQARQQGWQLSCMGPKFLPKTSWRSIEMKKAYELTDVQQRCAFQEHKAQGHPFEHKSMRARAHT